jgi:hypothetical protein
MSEARYRIEHWHLDEVSVLAVSRNASAGRYLELLRAAHASGVVVVVTEEHAEIVGWYPLWPANGELAAAS